jgi:hypothetical protein
MKFGGRFQKIEYAPKSPLYLIILLLLIIGIMFFLRLLIGL